MSVESRPRHPACGEEERGVRELDAKMLTELDRRRRSWRDRLWLVGLRALQLRGYAARAQREAEALRCAMAWRQRRLRLVAKR